MPVVVGILKGNEGNTVWRPGGPWGKDRNLVLSFPRQCDITTIGYGKRPEVRCVCCKSFSALNCHHLAAHSVGGKLVPGGGVEPPRPEGRRILSPLRLPVPPSRHFVEVIDVTACSPFLFFLLPNNKCETV